MKNYLFLLTFPALLLLSLAKPTKKNALKSKNYALFFAVEQYDDRNLKALHYPIQNARDIRVELERNYGFQCEPVVVNPTYRDIKNKLNQYAQNFGNGTFDKDGQLFIFFTGHGERESGNGFFLTKDTRLDELETTAFSYSYWRNKIDEIPCKHIFVAIDACKSGSFDPATESMKGGNDGLFGKRGNEPSARDILLQEAAKYKTRLFASSGAMDVSTPDNSAFAYHFLEALRGRGNLANSNDNILTIKELSTFFESTYPKPMGGRFGSNEANANFLFIAENAQNTEGVKSVATDREAFQNAQKQDNLAAYQNYLRQFPRGDFADDAKEKVRQLEQQEEDNAWAYAKSQNTVDGFNRFLSRYPSSIYANRARQLTKDLSFTFEPETVLVRGGTFQMGQSDPDIGGSGKSKNEQPVHSVTVSNFNMGKYEITVTQFKAFVDDTGYKTDAEKEGTSRIYNYSKNQFEDIKGVNWKCDAQGNIRPQSEYNHPVIHVSWNDADAYCKWLSRKTGKSYRLPTEAEWEYAAGNGSRHTKYSWGNGDPSGKNGGNVADETAKKTFSTWTIFSGYTDGYVYTAPVGQYNSNDFGLYDMTGNVWEWCSDWYSSYDSGAVSNPTGAATGSNRVHRGGSWNSGPVHCRVANRGSGTPSNRSFNLGFRVVFAFQ